MFAVDIRQSRALNPQIEPALHQADGTAPAISDETIDILHALGFYIASDPVLFQRVVRLVSFALGRHVKPSAPSSEDTSRITQVAAGPALPAQLGSLSKVCSFSRRQLL